MIKAVLFDMDGVLADTEPFWRESQVETFAEHGIEITLIDCLQTMGMRVTEVVQFWHKKRGFSQGSIEEIANKIVSRVGEKIETHAVALPGVYDTIASLENQQLLLSVVSSSHESLIIKLLKKINLFSVFDLVVSAQHLPYGKPHPMPYIEAARQLQVGCDECLVLEDSPNGVLAALAAGMKVVAVPAKEQANTPIFTSANLVLSDLTKFPADFRNILFGTN